MATSDPPRIISLEASISGREDCYYRVLAGTQVKYLVVHANTLSRDALDDMPLDFTTILPPIAYDRDTWNVVHISRDDATGDLKSEFSQLELAGVKNIWHTEKINFLELERVEQLGLLAQECIWKRDNNSPHRQSMIAKIARFEWEIPYIEKETKAYQLLQGAGIGPRFLGHIHEEGRVIGLLLEKVKGRHAGIEDMEICRAVLGRLHKLGILHRDCNRYNFVIGQDNKTATLIDFEACTFGADDESEMMKEIESLRLC